ncbi:MAG: hypothetical protein M1511_04160 [Deltaproteobacteria bacterium]|nr:hypothetical protein [Deltaproteobacteria bacterium]
MAPRTRRYPSFYFLSSDIVDPGSHASGGIRIGFRPSCRKRTPVREANLNRRKRLALLRVGFGVPSLGASTQLITLVAFRTVW